MLKSLNCGFCKQTYLQWPSDFVVPVPLQWSLKSSYYLWLNLDSGQVTLGILCIFTGFWIVYFVWSGGRFVFMEPPLFIRFLSLFPYKWIQTCSGVSGAPAAEPGWKLSQQHLALAFLGGHELLLEGVPGVSFDIKITLHEPSQRMMLQSGELSSPE